MCSQECANRKGRETTAPVASSEHAAVTVVRPNSSFTVSVWDSPEDPVVDQG